MNALKALLIAVMSLGLVVFVIWFAWTAIKNAFGFGGRSRSRGGYSGGRSRSYGSSRNSNRRSYDKHSSRRDYYSDYDEDFDYDEFEELYDMCYDLDCTRSEVEAEYRHYKKRGCSIYQIYDFIRDEYGEL